MQTFYDEKLVIIMTKCISFETRRLTVMLCVLSVIKIVKMKAQLKSFQDILRPQNRLENISTKDSVTSSKQVAMGKNTLITARIETLTCLYVSDLNSEYHDMPVSTQTYEVVLKSVDK